MNYFQTLPQPSWIQRYLKFDWLLTFLVLVNCVAGLLILFSASRQNVELINSQALKMLMGLTLMLMCAYLPINFIKQLTPWLYAIGLVLLLLVLTPQGVEVNGSQRWLNLGFMRFQPSEIMKLATPMMIAWYFDHCKLPPHWLTVILAFIICMIPAVLIFWQPDLGTALMVVFAGVCAIFLAGLSWRWITFICSGLAIGIPLFWQFVIHDYQRQRVLTLFSPESDPLGAGYHIIQSKIAIGSGGLYGKGWLNSTQANLQFLPEATTDFIYAIAAEEFGLVGITILIGLYFLIILRSLTLAHKGQDSFSRLSGGAISMNFFFCVFVNAGMVSGILPVVGVPLPFVSYGGTSIVTLFVGFGILMNIYAHRSLPKPRHFMPAHPVK